MTDACPPPNHKGYDRHDAVSYAPYPRSIPLARRRVAQLAVGWGHPGIAGDLAVLASELCTTPCYTAASGAGSSVCRPP